MELNKPLQALALATSALMFACPAAAACSASTKAAIASIDTTPTERGRICDAIGKMGARAEGNLTRADLVVLPAAASRLRRNGYGRPSIYTELLLVVAVRSPGEVDTVAAAHESSRGCLTPQLVAEDIMNALRNDPDRAPAMYRGWDHDFFAMYLVMVGRSHGCSFERIR